MQKFIHIHRNPYQVYVSNLHLYEKILPRLALGNYVKSRIEDFVIYSYRKTMQMWFEESKLIPKNQCTEMTFANLTGAPVRELQIAYESLQMKLPDELLTSLLRVAKKHRNYKKNDFEITPKQIEMVKEKWADSFYRPGV